MAARVNIIRFPVGTYGFAGRVPIDMAFELGGEVPIETRNEIFNAVSQCGPRIARMIANKKNIKMRERSFDTREEAFGFALNYRATSGVEFLIDGE
jgi:hypothetical protein